jgi:hypothetical protein
MIALLCFVLAVLVSPFKSKSQLEAENAALRHQVVVLRRMVHRRVRLTNSDRLFFIQLYRWFPSVLKVIIRPETLVRWHRAVMSALVKSRHVRRTRRCPLSANSGHSDIDPRKQKNRLAAVFPKCDQSILSQSARALRQAGASPEGEVRLFLRWACSDLKRLIGDFEGA